LHESRKTGEEGGGDQVDLRILAIPEGAAPEVATAGAEEEEAGTKDEETTARVGEGITITTEAEP
jgi:hypothetical protein